MVSLSTPSVTLTLLSQFLSLSHRSLHFLHSLLECRECSLLSLETDSPTPSEMFLTQLGHSSTFCSVHSREEGRIRPSREERERSFIVRGLCSAISTLSFSVFNERARENRALLFLLLFSRESNRSPSGNFLHDLSARFLSIVLVVAWNCTPDRVGSHYLLTTNEIV